MFTRSELLTLHRGYSQLVNNEISILFSLARPHDVKCERTGILEGISKHCSTAETAKTMVHQVPTWRVLFRLKKILYLEMKCLLIQSFGKEGVSHVISTVTRFSSAFFLDSLGAHYGQSV